MTFPAARHSLTLSGCVAGIDEEYGIVNPKASIAEATTNQTLFQRKTPKKRKSIKIKKMKLKNRIEEFVLVFAVYIPPQAPGPGHAHSMISFLSSSLKPMINKVDCVMIRS
jgi:hypothetical protein